MPTPASTPPNIASPPNRGVGVTCTSRPRGQATAPSRSASTRTGPMSRNVTTAAVSADEQVLPDRAAEPNGVGRHRSAPGRSSAPRVGRGARRPARRPASADRGQLGVAGRGALLGPDRAGQQRADLGHVGSVMPWVVTLGEPTRRPDGVSGGAGSYGMAFLFSVIRAASQRVSASRAGDPDRRAGRSARGGCRCRRTPRACPRPPGSWPAPGRWRPPAGVGLVLRLRRLPQRDRLGRDGVHQRAALGEREHRLVDRPWRARRGRGSCRRAGRAAPCAWWRVTTSA